MGESRTDWPFEFTRDLEGLADRLASHLENQLWAEVFKPRRERRLPSFLREIPRFAIGYSSALQSSFSNELNVIDHVLRQSEQKALYREQEMKSVNAS